MTTAAVSDHEKAAWSGAVALGREVAVLAGAASDEVVADLAGAASDEVVAVERATADRPWKRSSKLVSLSETWHSRNLLD